MRESKTQVRESKIQIIRRESENFLTPCFNNQPSLYLTSGEKIKK